MSTRKPGGNWMDGYRTTGFFIQWLTTKDPDAIRKFHETVRAPGRKKKSGCFIPLPTGSP